MLNLCQVCSTVLSHLFSLLLLMEHGNPITQQPLRPGDTLAEVLPVVLGLLLSTFLGLFSEVISQETVKAGQAFL